MAKSNSIIRVEKEGVEYYTLKTGESGMSLSGLASRCGVSRQAISEHLGGRQDEWKLDVGRVSVAGRRGSYRVVVVKDIVCAEVIAHYAQQRRKEAIRSLIGFAAMGIRVFIQVQTGWKPPSDIDAFIENHLLREARIWEVVFDPAWVKAAEQSTGWLWSERRMRHVIDLTVYNRLPSEVRKALDELNPVQSNGYRARKQHQHFSTESVEQVLKMQVEIARGLLLVSTSWEELKENTRRRFDGMAQLKLLS